MKGSEEKGWQGSQSQNRETLPDDGRDLFWVSQRKTIPNELD